MFHENLFIQDLHFGFLATIDYTSNRLARDAEMAKLYRKHVLKEPQAQPLVQIRQEPEEVGTFGD